MKKLVLVAGLALTLCACEFAEEKINAIFPQENLTEAELPEMPKEELKTSEKEEVENKVKFDKEFKFSSGESFKYNDFSILNSERIPFEISPEYQDSFINILKNLKKTTDENFTKDHADQNTMIIKFDGGEEMLFLIQSQAQNEKFYYKLVSKDQKIDGFYESDFNLKDKIKSSLIENYILNSNAENDNAIKIVDADLVKEFSEDGKYIILANISSLDFSYEEEIFSMYGGEFFPAEIHFENVDGKIAIRDFIRAKDGEYFLNSVKEMSRNDQKIAEELLASQNSYLYRFDEIMQKLKTKCEELKLKNYAHDLDKIPGYTENVKKFENDEGEPSGTVSIYKIEDLNPKKPSQNSSPEFIDGILYHVKTKIAIKTSKLINSNELSPNSEKADKTLSQ